MQIPRILKRNKDGSAELIAEVGVEDNGQLWALVVKQSSLGDTSSPERASRAFGAVRMTYDRWVRFDAIPFAVDEEPIQKLV